MLAKVKLNPDRETGLQRLWRRPPQTCENTCIVDYIARSSRMPADGGWAWKFDPDLPNSMKRMERVAADYTSLALPLGIIYGAKSELFNARNLAYMRELVARDFAAVAIDDAQHHAFLDQHRPRSGCPARRPTNRVLLEPTRAHAPKSEHTLPCW